MPWFKRPRLAVSALLLALLAACGSVVVNPVSGESERTVMDEQAEIAEGKKAHAQVLQEYGVVANPALQAYVNNLGQKLAAHSHRSNLEWHFTVLDSPQINAFALPGGYVYVTRGIMAYLDSEADLAGVMGHEIGHVTARHGAQRATRQQTAGLGVLAANILGVVLESQGVAGAGKLAGDVSQTVAAGLIASYGREQELQADGLGAEYLARNSYDPQNMVDVIRVLKSQEQFAADQAKAQGIAAPKGADWLGSHPSNDQRLERISQLAQQYRSQRKYDGDGRARYLQAIANMEFGDSAAHGLVRERNFYHAGLGLAWTAPVGWKIQNTNDAVTLINPSRDAAIRMRLLPAGAGSNQADLLKSAFSNSQGQTEATTLHGLRATRFSGTRQDAQGQRTPVEATVVSTPGGSNVLLQSLAINPQTLQRERAKLREAEESLRPLGAAERQAARSWVLKSGVFPRGGFAELAKASPLESAEAHLRLLNGFYGGGEPKPGQAVKWVQAAP